MNLHGHNLIAGFPAASSTERFRAVNPLINAPLEPAFAEATEREVAAAAEAAADAFAIYRRVPVSQRADLLEAIAVEIEALGDALLERAHAETGLPLARLQGERGRTVGQLRLFAEAARRGEATSALVEPALPDRKPLPRPELRRVLIPLGPVAVFGASNFPLAFSVAGGDTASALAAGCTVVVKGHPAHPGTSEAVAEAVLKALRRCGLPLGVFSLVHGGARVGESLVSQPALTAVGFTGSQRAGRALMAVAARRVQPIPVFAEMGSVNPVFLLPGALRQRGAEIAQGLLTSVTQGVGQFCTKPGLVFLAKGPEAETFMHEFSERIAAASCGTLLTRGIQISYTTHRAEVLAQPGVSAGGVAKVMPADERTEAQPSFAVTTGANFLQRREIASEVFGPFTVVVIADDLEQLLSCARTLEGQLTATLHVDEADHLAAERLLEVLEQKAGRVVFNGYPTGVEVSAAMNHGGPWPASSDVRFTSVGTAALQRFVRPICYQNIPASLVPAAGQGG